MTKYFLLIKKIEVLKFRRWVIVSKRFGKLLGYIDYSIYVLNKISGNGFKNYYTYFIFPPWLVASLWEERGSPP